VFIVTGYRFSEKSLAGAGDDSVWRNPQLQPDCSRDRSSAGASREAGQFTVGTDYPMARCDNRKRITAIGSPNCTIKAFLLALEAPQAALTLAEEKQPG
jgi:hypothetical protein